MRRKSSRNVSKVVPEKPPETATRKSRRHSKRHKRSSSQSSSEDSDNVSLKTVAQQAVQVPVEQVAQSCSPMEEDTKEPVWTVTPTAAPSGEIQKLKICLTRPAPASPDKNETSGRRRRNKSGSQADEDITSSEEKTPRKSRFRDSAGVSVEEQEEQSDETEDKKGKGKSKTKHKSKSEKTAKIQEGQDQTQSEISENVQVTPQSPQATIDIRVDNDSLSTREHEIISTDETETHSVSQNTSVSEISETVLPENNEHITEETPEKRAEDHESVTAPQTLLIEEGSDSVKLHNDSGDSQEDFKGFVVSTDQDEKENLVEESITIQEIESAKTAEPTVQEVVEVPVQIADDRSPELPKIHETASSPSKSENLEKMDVDCEVKEQPGTDVEISVGRVEEESTVDSKHGLEQDTSEKEQESEEVAVAVEKEDSHQMAVRPESKAESSSSEETESIEQKEEAEEHMEIQSSPLHSKDESSLKSVMIEESQRSDEDSRSVDAIIIDSSSTPNKEDTSFNLTGSFSPDVQEIVEVNKELQGMKDMVCDLLQTPPNVERRRKWGNSLVSLDLIKPYPERVSFNTIKELCPDLQFLEESEVKLDVRETNDRRRSLSDQKDRRTERKVSIEYKSSDTDHKRLETQVSVNSSEMEETREPEVDNSNIIAMNRKISIVDDTASKLKPPPSPAKNPISEVLYITNLVRPFTLKQLKELLERTGQIKENGFWTDRIKSKCYVYYETNEEAEATRNALHGVHWPIGNGKKLVIDFATPEDLEKARNPAPTPPQPVVPEQRTPDKENQVPVKRHNPEEPEKVVKERERHRSETHVREWDIGKEDMHRLQSRSREREGRNDRNEKRKHRRTPSPVDDFITRKQRKKEEDIPQKLMDDLFRKTKTTPSIYWLPLTPDEIATKQQQRLLRMAEHKRRMEESSRGRGDYGRGAPYRRRYD